MRLASQVALVVKKPPAGVGYVRDMGSIPGSERSFGEGNGNPFQYSCLGNPMDRGAWQPTVHKVVKSQTRLKQLSPERDVKLHMWLELFLLGMAVVDVSVRSCVWLTWFAGREVKIGVRILTSPIPAPVLPSLSPLCFHTCCAVDGCAFLCPGHQGSWTSLRPEAIKSFLLYCCWCSVAQSCATLCDPMDCSTPGFPVHH